MILGTPFLKRLAIMILLPASVLLGAYLTLPLWLPLLVRAQLAPGWQLESLEFDYPVDFVLHLDSILMSGKPGGIGIRVAARDLDIDIHQPSVDVSSMEVDVAFDAPDRKTDFFTLDDLSIPVIFRPPKLPRIAIDSLKLKFQSDGMTGYSLLFPQVLLERTEPLQSRLKTGLSMPGMNNLVGLIEIRLLGDSLEAKLQFRLPDHSEVLQIDFRQSEEDRKISTSVLAQGQLQDLQPLLLATFPALGNADRLKSLQGQVTFEGHFTGRDKQILDHAKLNAHKVNIDLGSESLGLDAQLEAQAEEGRLLITFPGTGKFHFKDHNNRLSGLLEKQVSATQNEVNPANGVNDSLLITIEPDSEIRLQIGARPAVEFGGGGAAEYSSALLDLSLEVAPDAQFRMAELLNPHSLSGSGTVKINLESSQALTFETTASPAMPLGASVQASGRLAVDGDMIRFTDSTAFRALIPRLTARFTSENTATGLDFQDLEFSGTTELSLPVSNHENALAFRYSGSVQSQGARISQSEPGKALQTLIDSTGMALQLDFSQSGEQLRTSGSGTVHNARLETSMASASQIDFEWHKVDPVAVSGEFRTQTRGLHIRYEEENYQGMDLDASYTILPNGRIEGQGNLLFASDIRAPVRFSGRLDSDDWMIDILPSQFSLHQAVKALETTVGKIPAQIELGSGTINISGSLILGNAVQGSLDISGKALGFSLAGSAVEGADFNISGKLHETLTGTGWFSIDRIGLAAGLDLFQTRVSVGSMTPNTIELNDLQAEFFGGQLSADQIRLSPQGLNDTQIEITDIDLGQVLEYVDVGGLKGTGIITISLPAGSQGTSLHISNGVFRANGPGILNYSESLSAAPAGNIGLSALENFHYTALSGTINYHPDGSYELSVHLAGSNPDLYDGYPITLNLNIGGMLPEAFEVLFLTGDFDKAILSRIRQEKPD